MVCMACGISVRITRRILPVFRKFRRVFSEQPTLIANSFWPRLWELEIAFHSAGHDWTRYRRTY